MNPFHQSSETTDKPAATQGLAARGAASTTGALDSSLENAVDATTLENPNTTIGALDASSDGPEVDPYVARAHASKKRQRLVRFGILGAAGVVALVLVFTLHKGPAKPAVSSQVNEEYGAVSLPLGQISGGGLTNINSAGTVSINGQLNVNNALVLTPTKQPTNPIIGQLYFDQTTNKLSYYNGSSFATILSGGSAVAKIGTATGNVATGSGLRVNGNTLSNSGVLTLQGQAGNVSLTSGGGIAINGTTLSNTGVLSVGGQHGNIGLGSGLQVVSGKLSNSGILSATAGQNITVTNDGHGGITISGSGGLSSSGGTAGKLAVFTGVQTIADSLISQSGSTITVGGNLNVTGSLTLGSPLSVSQGGTGVGSLPTDSVLIGNGTSGISGITGTSGDCLMADASGKPVFQACPGTSVTGTVTAGTITPDALTKFSGSSGQITSTGLTETGSTLSYAGNAIVNAASGFSGNLLDLQVNSSSKLSVNQAGSLVVGGDITASNGTVTAQNFSGNGSSLTSLNGSAIASGTVANSYLTGSGALSVSAGNGLTGGGNVALGSSTSLAVNAGSCITVSATVAVTDNCVNAATLNGQAGSYYTNASNINAGTIGDSYLSGNVTLQGNTFNGVGELVQLDATTGYLPILNGTNLTNLNGSAIASGTVANTYLVNSGALSVTAGNGLAGGGSVALGGSTGLSVQAASGGCITVASGGVSVTNNCVNAAQLNGNSSSYYTNASNINAGTIGDTYLSTNVTLQGNTFNGIGELVQLDATTGYLPILNGSALTNLNGSAIASGTVANTYLTGSGALSVTAGNGLTGGGSVALGGSTTLNVAYGSSANTAVQGNIALTCAAGTGNLSGGGDTITLGSGGNCSDISITSTPSFSSVTLGDSTAVAGQITLHDGSTANSAVLQLGGALSGNVNFTLPNGYTGTQTICTIESGNCAGSGSGVTASGTHTQNYISKFSNSGGTELSNSSIYDNGTGVSIGSASPVGLFNVGASNQFQVSGSGSVTAVGINSGSGLLQGTGGLTVGGTITFGGLTSSGGQCLTTDASGKLALVTCLSGAGGGSGGVASINGDSGTLTLNNAAATDGSHITIDNAVADGSTKGIATFDANNFNDNGSGLISIAYGSTTGTSVEGNTTIDISAGTGLTGGSTITLGSGGTATLNVSYGSAANTAAEGNTSLTFTGAGNLTGTVSGTAGGGFATNTLALVNNPTFTGLVTANGLNAGSGLIQGAGGLTVSGGDVTLSSLTTGSGSCLVVDNTTHKVGTATCATGSGSSPTFQDVYSNSGSSPLIALNTTGNGLVLQDASTPIGTSLFTIESNDGLTKYFNVTASGASVAGSFSATGTVKLSNLSSGVVLAGSDGTLSSGAIDLSSSTDVSNTLGVGNGGTGASSFANSNGAVYYDGSKLATTTAGTTGECLLATTGGAPSFGTCTGAGGVASIQGNSGGSAITGALTLDNATTSGTTITIDDASTTTKGIASFSATNFDVSSGTVSIKAGGISGTNIANGAITNANLASGNFGNITGVGTLGSLTVSGVSSLQGNITVGVAGSSAGVINLANGTNSNLASIQTAILGQATTYTLPDPGQATADICLSTGNCASAGGGVTNGGTNGTTGTIAMFTGANTIGNSILTQTGTSSVGVAGTFSATGTINGATISGGSLTGGAVSGGTLTNSAVNGLSVGATSIQGNGSANLAITAAASGNHNLVLNGSGTGIVVVGSGTASPYTGNVATFTGTVSGTAGTDPNDLTTYSQVQNLVSSGISGASGNYVQFASGTVQTNSSANSSIFINNTGAGKLIQLQAGGTDKFVVDNTGLVTASNLLLAGGGSIDTSATGALNIGKTSGGNATSISLNQNTTIATGKTFTANGSGFDATGNLGIGTTAPSAKLDVQGGLPTSSAVNITSSGTATSAIEYSGNSLNINRSITANTTGSTGVQLDTATTANASGNLTKSFTVGNHTNRFLLIEVAKVDAAVPTITYAGTSVPQIGTVGNMYIYALANPTVGTNNLVATNTSGQRYNVGISSWYNVSQANPYSNFTTTTGTGGTASLTLTTTAGQVVVDQFTQYDIGGLSVSPGAGQTSIYNTAAPYEYLASSYMLASSTSLTMSESGTANGSHTWIYAALALNPATGGLGPAITGSLADLSSNCTLVGASGCADTSNILNLSQQYTGATGAVLNIQNAGTGDMLDLANGSGTVVAKFDASGNFQTSGTIIVGTTPGSTANVATFNGTVSGTEAQSNGQFTTLGQVNSLISSGVGGAAGNYIANGTSPQTANFNIQGAANSSPVAKIDVGSSTGDILQVGDGTLTGFTVDNAGFNTFYGDTTFDGYALLGTALDSSVTGTAINIGQITGGNATSINLNQNTIVNGTFQSSGTLTATGLLAANGGVTIATGNNFVNGGSTLNSSKVLSLGASGDIGAAATTVDAYTTFDITASASGLSFTLPSPTVTTSGRIVYINNVGTNSFTLGSVTVNVGASSSFIWNGTSWTSTAVSTGVSLVGAYSTSNTAANGATISGNTITFQSASATAPGMVDTGVQTFQGSKTFNSTDSGTIFAVQAQGIDLLSVNANGTTSLSGLSVSGAGGYATLQGGADITGSASTGMPALRLALTPATSNTSSLIQVGSAIQGGNGSGTYIGLNAASGYGGDLLNFQVGGVSKFKIDASGNLTNIKGITASGDVSISGNVGIGTTTPSYNLDVQGTAGALTLYQNGNEVCDTSGNCAGSGNGGGVTNAGHQYYLTKTDASGNLVDSQIYDDGTKISIGSTSPGYNLQVNGTIQGTTILQGSNTVCDTSGNCGYNGAGTGAGVASVNTLTGDLTLQGTSQIIVTNTDTSHIGFSIQNDSIDDTQLKYDTGQNLTTSSTPTFAGINLGTASQFTVGNDGSVTTSGLLTANGGITIGSGKNFVNGGSTLNSAKALSLGASGAIGTAAATVDAYTTFNVTATATSLNFSLPSPTVTTAGRLAYISNIGTNSFTIGSVAINSGASASFIWNGTSWTSTAVSTGVSLVGAIDTQTASANGAVINGNSIYLQSASTTAPGLVNTAAQNFKGNKSFTNGITIGDVSNGIASSIDFVQGGGSSALIHLESAGVNGLDATVYLPPIDGSTICVDTGNCDGSTGNGGYIVNSTSPQVGTASFNITGSGTIGGNLTASGGALITSSTLGTAILGGGILTVDGTNNDVVLDAGNFAITANTGITGNISITSTPTASATASLIQIGSAIQGGNASGTYLGLNAASGYAGDLMNLQVNGASKFNIDASGNINTPGYYKQGGQIVINTTTGTRNVYIGLAGNTTTTGDSNAALGYQALYANTSGYWNTAVGTYALGQNTTGQFNAAFGMDALVGNTSGRGNVALGYDALGTNTSGWFNTGIGYNAAGAATIQYASAIGANSYVSQSNSIILGCVSGTNSCNTTTKIGIGNTAPTGLFSVGSSSQFQIDINGNTQTSGTLKLTGTPTASATSSLIQVGSTVIQGGNANGTYIGLNTASGYSGDLLNFQVNGASKFEVDASGNLNAGQITVNGGGSWTTISNTGIDYTDTGGTFTISGAAPVVLNSSSFGVASFGQDGLDVQNASNKIVLGVSSTGTITLGDSTSGNYATFTAGGGYTATGTARHIKTISLTAEYAGAVLDASSDTTGTTNCSTNNSGIMASGFDNTNKMNFYEWASSNSSTNCYDVVVQIPLPADFDGWASSPGTILSKNSLGTANAVCIEALNALGNIDSNYGGYKCFTPGTGLTSTNLTSFGDTYTAGDTLTLKIRLTSTSNTDITKIGNLQLQYYSKF